MGKTREEKITENLKDSGCDDCFITEFQECCCQEKQLRMLTKHRKGLLDKMHRCQGEIDCLDYLVYTMEKEQKEKEAKETEARKGK